jgi:glutaredoxin
MKARLALLALSLSALASPASAISLEDLFRGAIDKQKAGGKAVREVPLAGIGPEITKASLSQRSDALPAGREVYVVFTRPGCKSCDTAIERIRKQGYKPELLDVSKSATAREAYGLVGAQGLPTVLVGRYRLNGYSDKLFVRALTDAINDRTADQKGSGA